MGNLNCTGNGGDQEEENTASANSQPSKYTALLGPMFGGSFPASVAIYVVVKDSSDVVKLFVFGSITLAVFAIASGLVAATSLGRTVATARYARYATVLAINIALGLFASALCTLFSSAWYEGVCGTIFGLFILGLDVWMFVWW